MPRTYRGSRPFPNHVRAEREAQSVSQSELAEKADIERPWLSRIENGEALATPQQLNAIAEALGVSVSRLYDPEWLKVIGAAAKAQRGAVA